MDDILAKRLLGVQRDELTEHFVYKGLARREKNARNRATLEHLAAEERKHYEMLSHYTGVRPPADRHKVRKYAFLARTLGLTFAVKLMENGEASAQTAYREIVSSVPETDGIMRQEEEHERQLMSLIDEERMRYVGSVVLGLNDALVELTGALAGFTLALGSARLIAATGLITGVAAALSMAASEYLSTKTENAGIRTPAKAALYTGIAYIITVAALIVPFLALANPISALLLTVSAAVLIILAFSYYVSVTQDVSFRKRFAEMAALSLTVASVSFGIGYLVRGALGVDV